ncbi:CLUMA_CG021537, isoform A [Clunio marinus]|uniref:CLUMA_CG021537, isoform A n=1 Tax=Clunio marinus TaxID=568069 RepID=A0A1J1J955_9DIPT|nr:CLUMA_CG021537, isoform A [Clunio marinus]
MPCSTLLQLSLFPMCNSQLSEWKIRSNDAEDRKVMLLNVNEFHMNHADDERNKIEIKKSVDI